MAPQIGFPPAIAVIPAPAAAPMAPPDSIFCCVLLMPEQPIKQAASKGMANRFLVTIGILVNYFLQG